MEHVDSPKNMKICNVLMKLPTKLRDSLLPFQKEGVRFAVQKNGRCLIADEMGLGKTLQAISVAYFYKDEWPLLIIVPSSLKFCWVEELEKWLPDILPHEINLVQSGSDVSGMAICPITVVTYGLMRLPSSKVIREALGTRKFQVVICDESHYLKNISTLSCKTVIPLLKAANRRILLSGTPALAKPVELYPQIDAVCPGKFGSFWQYTDKYCDAHNVYFGKFKKRQINGASNLEELQQKLKSMLMIRREKSDVLTELPPKQRQRILFELKSSPLKKEIFDTFTDLKRRMRAGDGTVQKVLHTEGLSLDEMSSLSGTETAASDESRVGVYSLISKLYKLSGEAKIGPVREYIEMLCEDEQLKFLVFAYHHDMMDGIQQTLWEKKVKFVRIDGRTRSSDRQAFVTQFQSDPETRVAILSILAAGVGLTLTAAKLVVFSELYWTPGVMVQCEDRAHRIGQTCSLPVHYLVARDTMDEWVWSAVCRKTLVTSTALNGQTRKLDHSEGDSYQVELLSNADMWKLEEGSKDIDVSQLVQSQRSDDQSSILEFFTSQRSPDSTPARKRKHLGISEKTKLSSPVSAFKSFPSLDEKNCQKSRREISDIDKIKSKSSTLTMKVSEVIVVSDDEDEFKPSRKMRKTESRKSKNRKEIRAHKNKQLEKREKCDVVESIYFEKIPTFDLNYFEDPVNKMESSYTSLQHSDSSSSLSEISFCLSTQNFCQDKVKCASLEKQLQNNELNLCFSQIMADSDLLLKDSYVDHKKEISSNTEHLMSSNAACDHLDGSQDEVSKTCLGLDDNMEQQLVGRVSNQWSCNMCTFFNHLEIPQCEMCDTPKKKSASMKQQKMPEEFLHTGHDCSESMAQTVACSKASQGESLASSSETAQGKDLTSSPKTSHSEDLTSPTKIIQDEDLTSSTETSQGEGLTSLTKASQGEDSASLIQTASRKKNNPSVTCDRNQLFSCEFTTLKTKSSSQTCATLKSNSHVSSDNDSESSVHSHMSDTCRVYDAVNPKTELKLVSLYRSTSQEKDLFPSAVTKAASENCCESPDLFDEYSEKQVHVSDFDAPEKLPTGVQSSVIENISGNKLEVMDPETSYSTSSNWSSAPPQHSSLSSKISTSSTDQNCSSHQSVISTDGQSSSPVNSGTQQESIKGSLERKVNSVLKFSCSVHTGRIYVYDENEQFLQASFHPVDLEMGSTQELPEVLLQPHNLRLLQKFLREWSSLTETKKRLIAKRCHIFTSPQTAYEEVKTVHGSKQRHLNKQDTLDAALKNIDKFQGSVRLISKQLTPTDLDIVTDDGSGTSVRAVAQAVTEDGVPLCLQCQRPYSNPLLSAHTITNPENAWQLRLCSFACMDKYWTLTKAGYCRDKIYDIEHGVCQLCKCDAQTIFTQVQATKNLIARADIIKKSPFRTLAHQQRKKMVEQPQAGQFWHVDHITPVWQGGGLCDLDNLRTLCTPCHLKVTRRQAGQRATMKKLSAAAGQADITAFFQRS